MLPAQHILAGCEIIKQGNLVEKLSRCLEVFISSNIVNLVERFIHTAIFRPQHNAGICQLTATLVDIFRKAFCNCQRLVGKPAFVCILYKGIDINQACQHFVEIVPGYDYIFIAVARTICLVQDTLTERRDITCAVWVLCRISILAFLEAIYRIADLDKKRGLCICILGACISL